MVGQHVNIRCQLGDHGAQEFFFLPIITPTGLFFFLFISPSCFSQNVYCTISFPWLDKRDPRCAARWSVLQFQHFFSTRFFLWNGAPSLSQSTMFTAWYLSFNLQYEISTWLATSFNALIFQSTFAQYSQRQLYHGYLAHALMFMGLSYQMFKLLNCLLLSFDLYKQILKACLECSGFPLVVSF